MSEAVHVDDDVTVSFKTFHTEAQILDGLRILRDANLRAEIFFSVKLITWSERISQEMVKTFQYHQNLGRHWKFADFVFNTETTNAHIHSVLQSQVTTDFFRQLTFSCDGDIDYCSTIMNRQLATSLANLLRHGRSVSICNFQIEQNCMAILSQGLETLDGGVGGSVGDSSQKLTLNNVWFLNDEDYMEGRSTVQCLVDGLVRNRTLNSFCCSWFTQLDGTAAKIVRSFVGHPLLTELEMNSVEFGNRTSEAISLLLASPTCKVSTLALTGHRPHTEGGGFNFERFMRELPVSTSVQSLVLSFSFENIDHHSANQLLRSLWKFPNLQYLDLSENSIQDLVKLAGNLPRTNPHSHLRILDLSDIEFDFRGQAMSDEESTLAILHFLDVFPVVRSLGDQVEESFPAIVRHRLDWNGCSGRLLRGAEVPLSVWAVVLAKVDTYPFLEPSGKETIIYNMLHGPVFAGRGPLKRRKRKYSIPASR